jgi:hypothetical protein
MHRTVGLPPHPSGQAHFGCPRPDPNGPIQTDSDTKIGRPAEDTLNYGIALLDRGGAGQRIFHGDRQIMR